MQGISEYVLLTAAVCYVVGGVLYFVACRTKKKPTGDNPAESRVLYVLVLGALWWLLSGTVYPLGMLAAPLILHFEDPEMVESVVRYILAVWVISLIILAFVMLLAFRKAVMEEKRSQILQARPHVGESWPDA